MGEDEERVNSGGSGDVQGWQGLARTMTSRAR